MNIKLKPCPFCGGEAALTESPDDFSCQVRCTKCGAETREIENIVSLWSHFIAYYLNAIEAAEAWNKRAGESE